MVDPIGFEIYSNKKYEDTFKKVSDIILSLDDLRDDNYGFEFCYKYNGDKLIYYVLINKPGKILSVIEHKYKWINKKFKPLYDSKDINEIKFIPISKGSVWVLYVKNLMKQKIST